MKILYINPGRLESGLDAVIKSPPLALLSIAAMVPEHEAELFDFKVDKYNEKKFRKLLRKNDVVAITSMTPQIYHALEVADMAKQEGCITIIGGYHPTLDPESVISHKSVDYIVRGEGEHTFYELINYIDGNRDNVKINEIDGISYKNSEDVIIHNRGRNLEQNLDVFPFPRRDLLKGKNYLYMGAKVQLLESSRGCPHNCKFCCIIKMWNDPDSQKMRYRTKSLKRIMQEIYSIDLDYYDFIFFSEDNFTIDVKRTNKILDAIIRSRVNRKVLFSAQSRVDTIVNNPQLADKLKEAGVRQIFLGIESVHQKTLDAIGKHTNPDMIRKAVKMLQDRGISIFGGMIIGFPGEDIDDVRANIEFAKSLEMECVQFTPITAFPGTDFFEEMKQLKRISTYDYKYYNLFTPMMVTDKLKRNEIFRLVAEAYAGYYLNVQYAGKNFLKYVFDKNFSWFRMILAKFIKQFIFGGWSMLNSQGINLSLLKNPLTKKTDNKVQTVASLYNEVYGNQPQKGISKINL